ncbi:hypothetical protein RIR_jg6263.t1 [Rhizophagus irregularis DAOM 181602=DAOM 197198]|nr:hypothetical protein RIR_jg6263.t1 [Rhizophagus irregularis DAOM 181602=DAOM 197198]CAB4462857.1 unnamed protein product [Rhizophagus irregularis]CAB5128628.1 unnamed protein product [Rhizophagus irregularis]
MTYIYKQITPIPPDDYETEFFICDEPVVKLKIERENGNETSQRWQIIGFFEVVGNALINDNSFKNDDLIKLLKGN